MNSLTTQATVSPIAIDDFARSPGCSLSCHATSSSQRLERQSRCADRCHATPSTILKLAHRVPPVSTLATVPPAARHTLPAPPTESAQQHCSNDHDSTPAPLWWRCGSHREVGTKRSMSQGSGPNLRTIENRQWPRRQYSARPLRNIGSCHLAAPFRTFRRRQDRARRE